MLLLVRRDRAARPSGVVPLKMLPYDNKNEFQVVIDMPEGTTLEAHRRGRAAVGRLPGAAWPR